MGVAGSGKTTVGKRVAARLPGHFLDGDDFHPAKNIEKMTAGLPLTDADREPWLDRILEAVRRWPGDRPIVVACSALRETYRRRLAKVPYRLVYLKGTIEQIAPRLKARGGHFMPAHLLSDQFQVLEEPKDALVVSVAWPVEEIVDFIIDNVASAKPRP